MTIRVLTTNDLDDFEQHIEFKFKRYMRLMLLLQIQLILLLSVLVYKSLWDSKPNAVVGAQTQQAPIRDIQPVDECKDIESFEHMSWCQGRHNLRTLNVEKIPEPRLEQETRDTQLEPLENLMPNLPKPKAPDNDLAWLDKQVHCMALNIYHEARSEFDHWATVQGRKVSGAQLVAETTLNRAYKSGQNVCATVFEPNQFSWTADKEPDWASNTVLWNKSETLARELVLQHYRGRTPLSVTNFYAHNKVTPEWASKYRVVVRLGNHTFLDRG